MDRNPHLRFVFAQCRYLQKIQQWRPRCGPTQSGVSSGRLEAQAPAQVSMANPCLPLSLMSRMRCLPTPPRRPCGQEEIQTACVWVGLHGAKVTSGEMERSWAAFCHPTSCLPVKIRIRLAFWVCGAVAFSSGAGEAVVAHAPPRRSFPFLCHPPWGPFPPHEPQHPDTPCSSASGSNIRSVPSCPQPLRFPLAPSCPCFLSTFV